MSHSDFLLDPLLLQEDERNKNNSSSSQRASSIKPETPFIEQKVPFIKQEQEEEHVYHPVSTHVGKYHFPSIERQNSHVDRAI